MSAALDRRPNAAFDVVAVSPAIGSQAQMAVNASEARRHADAVLRSLASMGLPAERVSVTSVTSPGAKVNEVHVFVRCAGPGSITKASNRCGVPIRRHLPCLLFTLDYA